MSELFERQEQASRQEKNRLYRAMRYSAKPCPIHLFPMEAVSILASCLILPFKDLGKLNRLLSKSRQ